MGSLIQLVLLFSMESYFHPQTYTVQKQKGSDPMYYGTKGWYVAELKKLGVRYHEGRKLESYRGHILRNLLLAQQEKLKER